MRRMPLLLLLPLLTLPAGCLAAMPAKTAQALKAAPADAPKPKRVVNGNAPAFDVTTIDGVRLNSQEIYGDKPVFISLWATWCGPCRKEAPVINELYDQYGDQVQFVAISLDGPGDLSKIQSFRSSHGLKYPIAHDTQGVYGQVFQAQGIPKCVMVDLDGNVAKETTGFGSADALKREFREAFKL
ncbi:MAG TPA: TlpA disulfide reductase family protein [bacterium]|nr:TlpA disulfide reductase family protein [bacterium]